MARATPPLQQVVDTGLNLALTAAPVDGEVFAPGRVALYVLNGSGGSITVTIPTTVTVRGRAVADAGGAVPAGQFRIFGPFPASDFAQVSGDPSEGQVFVNYSAVTTVTRALFTL